MYSGVFELAGHAVCIESIYDTVQHMCAPYATERQPEATLRITPQDMDFELSRSSLPDSKPSYLETLAVYRKLASLMLGWNVLLFHGSAVAVDGKCYLFTAPSGTGKSTHTRLWREMLGERAVMVNDDKPLLHITPDGVTVYGTPWDGKHHLSSNIAVPLQAICLVTRGDDNFCEEIKPGDMLQQLLSQSFISRNPQEKLQAFHLLDTLSHTVKFYRLRCNMEPEAAQVSFRAMAPQGIEDMLRFDGVIMHGVKGVSMRPMLKQDRDLVIIESGKPVNLWDVVLFKRTNGKYVLHRVTEIKEDYLMITGDNCRDPERVLPSQVLGVMTHFIRKGKNHAVSETAYQCYVWCWCHFKILKLAYYIAGRLLARISAKSSL